MIKGGLKLKRELAPKISAKPEGPLPVAQVWVDASIYHLDSPFSYLIPGDLTDSVAIGSLVSIPFHGREIMGVVIELTAPESLSGLKSITKVIGALPLITPQVLDVVREAAKRYAAHPFDLLRSALPDRVVSVEREFANVAIEFATATGSRGNEYLQLPPGQSRSRLMAQKISKLANAGGVLALLPDTREVQALSQQLSQLGLQHVILDSQLSKSDYYRNFLELRFGKATIAIGTRSAVFAPVSSLKSILIYNEGSEHFYEKRSPGWNVRDIALLRTHHEPVDLYFVGYSPSTEIARFIDEEWVNFRKAKGRINLQVAPQANGELLPSRALAPIRKALQGGPVLFIVPLKGYAQAIRCSQCRTVSRCQCGGAHEKLTLAAPITCNHCLTQVAHWKCIWCQNEKPSMQSRGAERHHQELGRMFPKVAIHIATADHKITETISAGIVISTPGMAPSTSGGYSAVVILEGNRFLNQPDMRSAERIREMYFAHAALARTGAPIILIQDDGNSIATALTTWNPSISIHRELEERKSLNLPPYVRAALLTMEISEITRFKNALLTALEEGRIPASTKILGPIPAGEKSSLILTVDVAAGDEFVSTLHEFMRRRSAAKKKLPTLRIDPYSLSH